MLLMSVHVVHLYSSIDNYIMEEIPSYFISERSDFHMTNNLSIAIQNLKFKKYNPAFTQKEVKLLKLYKHNTIRVASTEEVLGKKKSPLINH